MNKLELFYRDGVSYYVVEKTRENNERFFWYKIVAKYGGFGIMPSRPLEAKTFYTAHQRINDVHD